MPEKERTGNDTQEKTQRSGHISPPAAADFSPYIRGIIRERGRFARCGTPTGADLGYPFRL